MLSASDFGYSLKKYKQGSRRPLPITAYLGAPTSDLHLHLGVGADPICPWGTRLQPCKIRGFSVLDETG